MKPTKNISILTLLFFIQFLIFQSCQKDKPSQKVEWIKQLTEIKTNQAKQQSTKQLMADLMIGYIPNTDSVAYLPNLQQLYSTKENLWSNGFVPNEKAKALVKMIQNANHYGFDSNYFHYSHLKQLMDSAQQKKSNYKLLSLLDIHLSNEAIRFATFNKYGFTSSNTLNPSVKANADTLNIIEIELLKNGIVTNKLKEAFAQLSPENPFYGKLQKGLEKFLTEHPISNSKIQVRSMAEDSAKAYEEARSALLTYAYLDSSNYKDDSAFYRQLKHFQKQHGLTNDGKIGSATAFLLSTSNEERYQKAAISLEKLRHKRFDSANYFLANIPAYMLDIVEDHNKIVGQHRVVVGKNTTRTPTFDAVMKYIIINPHWAIPYSISSQEILPQIQKNVSVIEQKGYKIMDKNQKQVDYASIDWTKVNSSNFNYRITQTRSGATALGKVKFIFPNDYSIYFHDTPAKSLFQNDIRAYSHGCVRVHEPLKLAKYILNKEDKSMTLDSVESIANSSIQRHFNLKKGIAVHIDYYTSFVDEEDNIQFYRDIYDRDDVYKNLLFSKKTLVN